MTKNNNEKISRTDKIVKLELMIEEYGIKELFKMVFEAYNNINDGNVTRFSLKIETSVKIK